MEDVSISLYDDGLFIPEVGHWTEEKYKLIQYYAFLFSTSMKRKWDARIYIDLFAGGGFSRLKETSKIVAASPLLTMDIIDPFDKYIFCEIDSDKLNALKVRTKRYFPKLATSFVPGDVNSNVELILDQIPRASRKYLTFCLVDPYKLGNLQFETIHRLSNIFIDFLVLIPTYMDAKRSWMNYLKPNNQTIELFIAQSNWRASWEEESNKGVKFGNFLITQFNKQMEELRFLISNPDDIILMKIRNKNVSLYHLIFYSRNKLGMKFWRDAVRGSSRQLDLFHMDIIKWAQNQI